MQRETIRLLCVLMTSIVFMCTAHGAELQPPKVGLTITWDCTGPFTERYQVRVSSIKDDIVTYQGRRDDEDYWVEKASWLTGTTLWFRKSSERYQWFDKEDFERYREMQPGSKFKGAVPARDGADKWVWDYQVSIDSPQRLQHAVLGAVTVIPVTEKRRVYHGDYWSEMISFIMPEKGFTVRWIYEDPRGIEDCDITDLVRNGQISKARKD